MKNEPVLAFTNANNVENFAEDLRNIFKENDRNYDKEVALKIFGIAEVCSVTSRLMKEVIRLEGGSIDEIDFLQRVEFITKDME